MSNIRKLQYHVLKHKFYSQFNGDIYYKVYTIDENGKVTDKDTKENPNEKAKSFTK